MFHKYASRPYQDQEETPENRAVSQFELSTRGNDTRDVLEVDSKIEVDEFMWTSTHPDRTRDRELGPEVEIRDGHTLASIYTHIHTHSRLSVIYTYYIYSKAAEKEFYIIVRT